MKLCPKCRTPNQDKNYYCVECNAVLSGVPKVDDAELVTKKVQQMNKAAVKRKWTVVGIFAVLTIIVDVFILFCGLTSEAFMASGRLSKFLLQLLWLIPIGFAALFDFDSVYCRVRAKKGLPEKHLSDFVNTMIVGGSIACWFFLQCSMVGTVIFVQ